MSGTAAGALHQIGRRVSRRILVGGVEVGGDAPITVQSMTNTLTSDVSATVAQVHALAEAGADLVRVSCPDEASTAAFGEIVRESPVPLVADIHFHYRRALEAAAAGGGVFTDQSGQYRSRFAGFARWCGRLRTMAAPFALG